MKLSTALALRIGKVLQEKGMSQYRLERKIAMSHSTLNSIMTERNKSVNLTTLMLIIKGLEIEPAAFFDDPLFTDPELIIE